MTFTCYNTQVLLLDIGKMQYRFDTYMFTINFIIQCLTLVLRLVSIYGDLIICYTVSNTNMMNSE